MSIFIYLTKISMTISSEGIVSDYVNIFTLTRMKTIYKGSKIRNRTNIQ